MPGEAGVSVISTLTYQKNGRGRFEESAKQHSEPSGAQPPQAQDAENRP